MDSDFKSYSFREVKVFPPSEVRYYQLFKDGIPTPFVYSEKHLLSALDVLNSFEKIGL